MNLHSHMVALVGAANARHDAGRRSPDHQRHVPCNVIAEEILNDHPKRFRAMLVESANPRTRSPIARMREALAALDLVS